MIAVGIAQMDSGSELEFEECSTGNDAGSTGNNAGSRGNDAEQD
jgi:hypothetical protein